MNDIFIYDINWQRAILEINYTLAAPEAGAAAENTASEGNFSKSAAHAAAAETEADSAAAKETAAAETEADSAAAKETAAAGIEADSAAAEETATAGIEADSAAGKEPAAAVPPQDALWLYCADEQRFIPFTISDEGEYLHARLNIMTAKGREPLTKGSWIICRKIEENPQEYSKLSCGMHGSTGEAGDSRGSRGISDVPESFCSARSSTVESEVVYSTCGITYAPEILCDIDRYSRFFGYDGRTYAYAVWLLVKETEQNTPAAELNIDYYMRNPDPLVRKHSRRFMEKRVFSLVYRVFSCFARRKGKRILFYKQNGDHPTDNMEAIITRMRERGLDEDFSIACRCRNIFVDRQSLTAWVKDLWEIAKSDYIFIDDYAPIFSFIDLGEDVVLTQLWHAGVGFKSVGYARFGQKGSPDPFSSSHRHYTYALVGNEHLRDIYAEVFGIEEEALLATGMPRLEHFLDADTGEQARSALYGRYPALKKGRVILFAPTFRGTGQADAVYPYSALDISALHAMCTQTDSYFIFEMHHFIKERPQIASAYADRVWDLTDENLNELFYIADVLITDYSSCFYDFLLLKKPVILYVPDKLNYIAVHGVQRPIDEMAPGEVCETFAELLETLQTGHYETVPPKDLTVDRAAEKSGLASDRVIDTILFKQDVPGVKLRR